LNILFWLIVAVLIVIALVMVIWPLWRKSTLSEFDIDQRNIKIARERLANLKQQLQQEVLSQAQFDEQYQELELTLNDELTGDQIEQKQTVQGKWVIPVVVLFVPLLSLSLYFALGDPQALAQAKQQQLVRQQQQNINNMVAGLAERLKQQPDDAEGWLMLGRSYKYMNQYDRAAAAFAQAYRLEGDKVEVMLQYADALALNNGGKLSGQPAQLVFKALALSPDNMTALWLGGMAKVETGEFAEALQYWQKLEPLIASDSQSHQQLMGLITAVKSRLGGDQSLQAGKNIKVNVSIDKNLLSQTNANQTVFIYAQALNGPKMPLAIIRKQVRNLPLSVELNDTLAMTPAMKLSSFKQVKVIARVSKTGNAMQQPGDLIGFSNIIRLEANNSVTITINQQLK